MNLAVGQTLNRHKLMSEKSSAVKSGIIPELQKSLCASIKQVMKNFCVCIKRNICICRTCARLGATGAFGDSHRYVPEEFSPQSCFTKQAHQTRSQISSGHKSSNLQIILCSTICALPKNCMLVMTAVIFLFQLKFNWLQQEKKKEIVTNSLFFFFISVRLDMQLGRPA